MSDSELPRAFGAALLRGVLRSSVDDFAVEEDLGFAASGAGEHLLVLVEKRGANTEWVARQLAGFAGVAPNAVSFAGMKDRHAVTRQSFSIQLPGRADPDFATLQSNEFRVIEAARHHRKLKRGALKGNRFRIVLRQVEGEGDREDLAARVAARVLALAAGVPNYFGEQRFGRGGGNVAQALAMFGGRRVAPNLRSVLLSAARSHLFNQVVAARVADGSWNTALEGDVWMLQGSHAIFGPEPVDAAITTRIAEGDIHPTGPLWGRGQLRSTGAVGAREAAVALADERLARGLEAAGLEQERRSLRLVPRDVTTEWLDAGSLTVSFWLPAGAYATTVLREICDYRDAAGAPPETDLAAG